MVCGRVEGICSNDIGFEFLQVRDVSFAGSCVGKRVGEVNCGASASEFIYAKFEDSRLLVVVFADRPPPWYATPLMKNWVPFVLKKNFWPCRRVRRPLSSSQKVWKVVYLDNDWIESGRNATGER